MEIRCSLFVVPVSSLLLPELFLLLPASVLEAVAADYRLYFFLSVPHYLLTLHQLVLNYLLTLSVPLLRSVPVALFSPSVPDLPVSALSLQFRPLALAVP